MSGLLLAVGSFSMGYVVAMVLADRRLKKLQENAYHSGFEKGMEKAENDMTATLLALAQAEQDQQAMFASKVQELGYSISVEEATLTDPSMLTDALHYSNATDSFVPYWTDQDQQAVINLDSKRKMKKSSKKTVRRKAKAVGKKRK